MKFFPSSLALGLLWALPALAAPAAPRDDTATAPRAAIAIKLAAPAALRARSTGDDSSGPQLVEELIRKAQSGSGHAKRDAAFSVQPLITTLSPARLAEIVDRAVRLDPTYEPVDFGAWYQVRFDEPAPADGAGADPELVQLLANLGGFDEVASCQPLSGTRRQPNVQPADDPEFASQGYLTGSGVGIDAEYAWGFPGGDGAGVTVIDVERGWKLTHEDLVSQNITLLAGMNVQDRYGGNWPHGTAVLGEMLMADNTIGGVGIVPGAQGHVVGIQRTVNGAPVENEAEAILDAVSFLQPGDVILLEMQTADANIDLWPIEILDAQYDAIRTATAAGIIVVEPAANGGMDLDQPVLRMGETVPLALLNPASPDFRDSGAIMVGAGSSALPRSRMSWSGHGARVDVHAWGENIRTSSVVTSDWSYDDIYTDFSGTSGAAPIIAGAAISIQAMVYANTGVRLTPSQMRSLISVGGTASANPATDKIGVQPNLRALIDGGHLQ